MHASKIATAAACAAAAFGLATAQAQQPAPPAPAFAASDLSATGVRLMASNCASCHGTDGQAVVDTADLSLVGVPRERFMSRMALFKQGKGSPTVMHQLAKGYSDAEIAALADYFSKLAR